jgi:hypothetical protein
MLFCIALTSIGFTEGWEPEATKVLVAPSVVTAGIGDTFWIDINIEKVVDLYAYQFKVDYESGTKVLGAIGAEEAGFLAGPMGTAFAWSYDPIAGVVDCGETIIGNYSGISGSATLARVRFVVTEAGDSPLDLFNVVLLDSNLDKMPTQLRHGYFDGPNVELKMINIGSRPKSAGENATFQAKLQNEGDIPLYVKARVDNVRMGDGKTTSIMAGQYYESLPQREPEYLYVNNVTFDYDYWVKHGSGPVYLDEIEDGSYLEGNAYCQLVAWIHFEDIVLAGSQIDRVILEAYTWGNFDEDCDLDAVGRTSVDYDWVGSLYAAGSTPAWVRPRWIGADVHEVLPSVLTEEGLNELRMYVHYWTVDHLDHDPGYIDAMRLMVTFKPYIKLPSADPVFVIQPGEVLTLDVATWYLKDLDIGEYACTITAYYSANGVFFNAGKKKVITESWWVTE